MPEETQNFTITDIWASKHGWHIKLGYSHFAMWIFVSEEDYGAAPEIGDIATVQLPKVTQIVTP